MSLGNQLKRASNLRLKNWKHPKREPHAKIVGLKKKSNGKYASQYSVQRLSLVESYVFTPCQSGLHRKCAVQILDAGVTIPRVCACTCHVPKSRRKSPTIESVGRGSVVPSTIKHNMVNEGSGTKPVAYPAVGGRFGVQPPSPNKTLPGLKNLKAQYAAELQRGKELQKQFGGIESKVVNKTPTLASIIQMLQFHLDELKYSARLFGELPGMEPTRRLIARLRELNRQQ